MVYFELGSCSWVLRAPNASAWSACVAALAFSITVCLIKASPA
jgi:hypothetical protein